MRSLTLAVLSLALAMPAAAETASQVFQKISPSIVVVVTYGAARQPTEQGSGVMLPNRDVATNCHVLKDGTQYRVRYRNKDYQARLDKSDWNRDVCLLNVPSLPAPAVVLGNTKTLQVGAPVYAVGAPEGLQLTLSEGIVSSLRGIGDGKYIQTTAAISQGSSGGGLFDDQGRLLGLTSFFMSQGQQLNFALPVEWIEALPQRSTQRVAQHISEVDADRKALQINLQNADAWYNLGIAYDNSGRYSQAIDAFRQAVKINPQGKHYWYNLATVYRQAGQYSQAIDTFRQALQLNSRDADAWNNLGGAYVHLGQYSQGIDAYRRVLQINPQDEDTWYNLATTYETVGQRSQAIDAFRQALQLNPRDADAWNNLGITYERLGQRSRAIETYRQALQISPRDADAWYNLGVDYFDEGQDAQAHAAYQHLNALSPELAQKLFDLIVPK